jgi:RNA polymerase sigma factor (sigma-70 family)
MQVSHRINESGYNVQVRVRNNHILRRIRDQYGSSAEMCRRTGLALSRVSDFVCFRRTPLLPDGELCVSAHDLCSALGAAPEELWPGEMANMLAKKATYELELSQAQALALCSNSEQDVIARQLINKWSECLSDRQRMAIDALTGGITLEEAGKEMGVSRERIRQIQFHALQKMRHRAVTEDNVRTYREALGE